VKQVVGHSNRLRFRGVRPVFFVENLHFSTRGALAVKSLISFNVIYKMPELALLGLMYLHYATKILGLTPLLCIHEIRKSGLD
jgi:hypothetical protein